MLQLCHNQLNNYFNAINSKFDVPLKFQGTLFQQLVWNEILNIPYGQTISYSQLAQAIRKPQAVRAVAQACKSNSFAVIVPCHRIIAANGSLGGYNAGTERKAWLLDHEKYQLNTINF